jgi:tRNA(Arg) A34 adenosine deaminase TadA
MWQYLSQPWRSCLELAWAAYCAGSIPIGAIITDSADRVVARGRNRMLESSAPGDPLSGSRMAHAEINALLALGEYNVDPRTCALYTTAEPCPMCIGAIRMHHIGKVHYASRDPVAGSVALAAATPFMRRGQIEVVGPQGGDFERVLLAVLTESLLQHESDWAELAEARDPACTPGIELGRRLFESGELARLRADSASADEVLDTLARHLEGVVYQGG